MDSIFRIYKFLIIMDTFLLVELNGQSSHSHRLRTQVRGSPDQLCPDVPPSAYGQRP
jgi:hypothetical protein